MTVQAVTTAIPTADAKSKIRAAFPDEEHMRCFLEEFEKRLPEEVTPFGVAVAIHLLAHDFVTGRDDGGDPMPSKVAALPSDVIEAMAITVIGRMVEFFPVDFAKRVVAIVEPLFAGTARTIRPGTSA